jgi:hypothetical protein
MRAEQTVSEMAEEVLSRQASVLARRTGQPLGEAREAVLQTAAGCQLEELRGGVHQHEEVRYWQANLLFERVSEQAGHPVSQGQQDWHGRKGYSPPIVAHVASKRPAR